MIRQMPAWHVVIRPAMSVPRDAVDPPFIRLHRLDLPNRHHAFVRIVEAVRTTEIELPRRKQVDKLRKIHEPPDARRWLSRRLQIGMKYERHAIITRGFERSST